MSNLLLLGLRHTGICRHNTCQVTVRPCCGLCTPRITQQKFCGALSGAQHRILTGLGFEPSGSATGNSIWSCQASRTCKPKANPANAEAAKQLYFHSPDSLQSAVAFQAKGIAPSYFLLSRPQGAGCHKVGAHAWISGHKTCRFAIPSEIAPCFGQAALNFHHVQPWALRVPREQDAAPKDRLGKICTLTSLVTSAQPLVINNPYPEANSYVELAAPRFKAHWNLPS